ncbi:glycosyltransferase family 2 protein [Paenibacillus sp. FSL K6-2524]|uniref:glycosyltransferase family 2 protein n=1 Tax=Paenibacillus sp. FSL K6-2524 TaxID=2954516 RepID=UPI0030FC9471
MKKQKILVLLSTYNGERYICEQLDSLLAQDGVSLSLYIRDDGSTDSTQTMIEDYVQRYPEIIKYYPTDNIGAKGSFFELMELAYVNKDDSDYFAFCDQDDVWDKQKLLRALILLNAENRTVPIMYCSTTQMVDAELLPLSVWPISPRKPLTMYNALVENVAVGCTTVFNKESIRLLISHLPKKQDHVIMHDWWSYLCISTFGKVVFDEKPFIKYRQHSSNVLGGNTDSWVGKWKKRFQRFSKGQNHYIISNQAREFYSCYKHLLELSDKNAIQNFLDSIERNGIQRLLYILRSPFYRQSSMDNLILKVIYTLGKV